jgi:glycosyltransferase involved in cell wall biosynthesis
MVKSSASLGLFCYNQERYVKDSLLSALAQDYEPLEIIFSDDCSTDRSFEIAKEIQDNYTGRHRLIVRRNDENIGIIRHVKSVIAISSGDIFFCAAADDISLANRVSSCMAVFSKNEDVVAVHSKLTVIDDQGIVQGAWAGPSTNDKHSVIKEAFGYSPLIVGASMCFRKMLIDSFREIDNSCWAEDKVVSFRALLMGKVIQLPDSLVLYRRDVGVSSSNSLSKLSGKIKFMRDFAITVQKSNDLLHLHRYDMLLVVWSGFLYRNFKIVCLSIFSKLSRVFN